MEKTNKQFAQDEYFKILCANVSIDPTVRQASKFRNKKGLAYKNRHQVKEIETVPYIPAL